MIEDAVCNHCGVIYRENSSRAYFARYCHSCREIVEGVEAVIFLVILAIIGFFALKGWLH